MNQVRSTSVTNKIYKWVVSTFCKPFDCLLPYIYIYDPYIIWVMKHTQTEENNDTNDKTIGELAAAVLQQRHQSAQMLQLTTEHAIFSDKSHL